MKRGIFLVANRESQDLCENLVYSIRQSGCTLPIRLIHFGGRPVRSDYLLNETELLFFENFSEEAQQFVQQLGSVLTNCPMGFLYRYLAWFTDWEEFIYSDNDVVALCNWEQLFDYLENHDLVHADEEYKTEGRYNYHQPELIKKQFGKNALDSAITAGHFVSRKKPGLIADLQKATDWFKQYPTIPKLHDQALLHIASLIGNWEMLNLCKAPHHWLSSWAGDYQNPLQLVQATQQHSAKISHLHYSGSIPKGDLATQEFLFSNLSQKQRLSKFWLISLAYLSGFTWIRNKYRRFKRLMNEQ